MSIPNSRALPRALRSLIHHRPQAFPTIPCAHLRATQTKSTSSSQLFHTSHPLQKQKGGKQNTKHNVSNAVSKSAAANDDPEDFSVLDTEVTQALDRLKEELAKIRPGGRIGPDMIEAVRVEIKAAGGKTEKVRVGDLCQVVPKGGRGVVLLVGEEAHVKPIASAMLASTYSLNPQPSHSNPLELTLHVPPPTQESRDAARKDAGKVGDKVLENIKLARGKHQKLLRAMEVGKTVRPEEVKKARDKMEDKVQKANKEVKGHVNGAKKALDA